jgi:hypothetical protein
MSLVDRIKAAFEAVAADIKALQAQGGGGGGGGTQQVFVGETPAVNYPAISFAPREVGGVQVYEIKVNA